MFEKQVLSLFLLFSIPVFASDGKYHTPNSFRDAKPIIYDIVRKVHNFTLYCDCPIRLTHNKKGIPDLSACGYKIRKQKRRAESIEIEHIVPAWEMAHHLPCWKKGGRKACRKDREYNRMSGDLYNLWPAVGEVNGDRSNYKFGMMTDNKYVSYGQCLLHINFKRHTVEPPKQVRGLVARTYLYMSARYKFDLSDKQRKLFNSWNKQYPPLDWEVKRAALVKKYMGKNIYYVRGR